jgi:hypothetical protein
MDEASSPTICELRHPIFRMLGPAVFRRAQADGTPVMVVTLGEREAVMPLRALQREFGIDDESPDGRMLGLVAESLDYVNHLAPGDRLPSEVLTGEASWEPAPEHRKLAFDLVRLRLLAWLDPEAADPAKGDPLVRLENEPALRQRVQVAFERAAQELGLPGSEAVLGLVEELAGELAYIEALRERLLRPVQAMVARLDQLSLGYRGDHQRQESANRVHRLAHTACARFQERFDEVAAQTGEVMSALRNMESQQAFIRSNRDQLYRALRAWRPVLAGWTAEPEGPPGWELVARTYQFLAPRYMPATEWTTPGSARPVRPGQALAQAMTW